MAVNYSLLDPQCILKLGNVNSSQIVVLEIMMMNVFI